MGLRLVAAFLRFTGIVLARLSTRKVGPGDDVRQYPQAALQRALFHGKQFFNTRETWWLDRMAVHLYDYNNRDQHDRMTKQRDSL